MTPLHPKIKAPKGLASKALVVWRLERDVFMPSWQEGLGAQRFGGRWNPRGQPLVYACMDPATAILELAVHAGFEALDSVAHTLLAIEILKPDAVCVVAADTIADPQWLLPGNPTVAQQAFGAALVQSHAFVALPSVVSRHSWNLLINPVLAHGLFRLHAQERFVLDPRLAATP